MMVELNKHSAGAGTPDIGPAQPQLGRLEIAQLSAQANTGALAPLEATMPVQVPRQGSVPPADG